MTGEASDPLLGLTLAGFPVFFACLWLTATFLIGRLSGWSQLERLYPDMPEPVRGKLRGQSAIMGGILGLPANFNGCLTFELCPGGVRFRIWKIFGPFQKPFFVPWRDFSVEPRQWLFFAMARVRLARWEGHTITMKRAAWNRVVAEATVPGLMLRD